MSICPFLFTSSAFCYFSLSRQSTTKVHNDTGKTPGKTKCHFRLNSNLFSMLAFAVVLGFRSHLRVGVCAPPHNKQTGSIQRPKPSTKATS
eukprot:4619721-Amphidinium_carterae.1